MTKEDIIRMARESDIDPYDMCEDHRIAENNLERFAAFVAAYERAECAKLCAELRKMAIAEEREACAKVCEEPGWNAANWCAKHIRARGEK